MKPMQLALLLVVVWLSSFGIAFGVYEWRGHEHPDSDALLAQADNDALIAQAEACRSAVSWWNAYWSFRKDGGDEDRALGVAPLRDMFEICGEMNTSSEPDAGEN